MLTLVSRSGLGSTEKPREVVRGPASRMSWAWDGLCFGVPIHEAGLEGLRDIVNNVAPSATLNIVWETDNRGNPVTSQFGGEAWVQYPDHPVHDRPSTEFTAYARFKNKGIGAVEEGIFCNPYVDLHGSPWVTWTLQSSPTNANKLYGQFATGGTPNSVGDTAVIPTTEYVSGFLRWRSGEAPRLDFLGERGNIVSSVTGSVVSGALSYDPGQGIRINATESLFGCMDNYYSQCMLWSRRLSDVEMMSLVADPFGWYSPRRESVIVAAPFPVGPGMAAMPMVTTGAGSRR